MIDQDEYSKVIELLIKRSGLKNLKETVCKFAEWLDMSEASIYNKVNGRSKFTIEELVIICRKLQVSLDYLIYNSTSNNANIHFFADGLKYKPRNFNDYINNIIGYYTKIKQLQDVTGYFMANEVPLFHFLNFPNLMYFKLYIWNKINWKIPGIPSEYRFADMKNNPELLQSIQVLKELFHSFPNVEIWNPNMLDNTIAQFQYLKDVHIIHDRDDLYYIKKEFSDLIDHLEELTLTGKKSANSHGEEMECDIYLTDLTLGSEIILVKSEQVDMLFQQIDVPNYMQTSDQNMIDNQFRFFENIRKISTLITNAGEKERLIFFANMRQKLQRLV
ncbi:MAG: hypothetical protein IPN86_09220 [Saprospiraceae bacterium]|nr:hypothetical protein [Saprospiraceae bacterium]